MSVDTSTVQVVMPAMGDSVAEGTVLEWHKQEGDVVSADETIVEISTDKVDAEVPSPASGTITRIHAAEGDTVAVGALLAEIATNGQSAGEGEGEGEPAVAGNGSPPASSAAQTGTPVSGESPPTTPGEAVAGAATEAEGVAATQKASGQRVDIVTPTGGESVTEGTILEWSVKVGDTVKDGDTVVEISTDKVDMELPAPADGTITEILAQDGETVTVGQVIARMSVGAAASARPSGNGAATASATSTPGTSTPGTATPSAGNGASSNASPVARRVAAAEGVDLSPVQGTARGGRITKADVLGHGNGAPPVPAAPGPLPAGVQLIKGSGAALARYMDQSRSIPTATSFRTMTVTTLDERRKQLKNGGKRVSFTHLIAYAIAKAATDDMPVMAHHFEEIDGKPHRYDDGAVNLGLAVDVEKKDGSRTLMVPSSATPAA
jgi:multifunctional 2-oxoglutarate metabolism enzyme